LAGYIMTGRVLMRDWPGIIEEMERISQTAGDKVNISVATSAARAYLETGKVDEAVQCLEMARLPSTRMSAVAREISFVSFFSLSGAEPELKSVLQAASQGKRSLLPPYAQLYWLARCRAAQGKIEQCRQLLSDALAATPGNLTGWRDRISFQLERF